MRPLILIPLACLLTGCLAPGQRDPTRYPWDQAAAPHPPIEARGAILPLQVADARDNAAWARMSRHLPYCTAKDAERARRFPAPCITPGTGANSPLGPVWIYRQVNEWLMLQIKLRDLTPEELAALHPKPPMPPPGTYCVIALESRSTGITVNGNAMAMSACSVPANSAPNPAPANPPPR